MWQLYKNTRKYLDIIARSSKLYTFTSTLCAYFLIFLFNQTDKTLFIFLLILFAVHFLYFKKIHIALFLTYLTSFAFFVGKSYQVQFISPDLIKSINFPYGWNAQIVITPSDILSILLLLYMLREVILKKIRLSISFILLVLSGYFVLSIFSSFYSIYPQVSEIYALQGMGSLVFAWFIHLHADTQSKKRLMMELTVFFFCAFVIFQAIIGGFQYFKKGYLGSSVETYGYMWSNSAVDDSPVNFRSLGTTPHPNYLAQILVFLLPLIFSNLYQETKYRYLTWTALSSGIGILFLTWGRSAWMSAFIGLVICAYIVERKWKIKLLLSRWERKYGRYLLLLVIFVAIVVLPERLLLSIYSFGNQASGSTRLEEITIWMSLIPKNPLWGTGLGVSVPVAFKYFPNGVLSYFPESVHLSYLLICVEAGIIVFLLFVLFVLFSIRKAVGVVAKRKNLYSAGVLAGLIGGYINFFFQPYKETLIYAIILTLIFL